jgi:DNA helicase-2/ATP-dependent DNA helicase PcrA
MREKAQNTSKGSQKETDESERSGKSEISREYPNTSRQAEEAFLAQTLAVIEKNLENYGSQVRKMRAAIDEMLEHYHDDNPELDTLLNNTITLHDHMKRALERNEKAKSKPYFGRILFHDEILGTDESLYIGKGGISSDTTHQTVVDWRAPVANAYYENGLGKCGYTAPDGRQIPIELKLKRTYEIENGTLLDYFESEVIANDDLLTKYLSKNKQAVLGEIVATIQKEQNEIIRKSPYHNIIVQGVAGSGKTTVAMHRISFILYNYAERFRPDDFYIVGSNRILLNYITGVLPDLDVHGVRQMTMEQLFVRLLYEDWDDKKYRIRKSEATGNKGSIKGTLSWFEDLKAYCDRLEWESILRDSIYLNPRQFVEGCKNGKTGVYDETLKFGENASSKVLTPNASKDHLVLLVNGEAVERYILQTPNVSMQNKINMLNERLMRKISEEFLGKGVKYTESERKAIKKAYRNRYGQKEWKGSIYQLYRDFLAKQNAEGKCVEIPDKEFDVYDLAALAYIYKRIKETEVISEAHHIVIDEAQDFGMMAYSVLHFCIHACTYTIMGDVSQNIHFGFGLNDWEELKNLMLPDPMDSFCILKKSYRNTVEISNFAIDILHHGQFSSYPVEPIIRHGSQVEIWQGNDTELFPKAAETCQIWQEKGYGTIAVICRNQSQASLATKQLARFVNVIENDPEKANFGNGIMVLPVEYTKGLEFDAVLILNPDRDDYPSDDGHAKLLYVAATRALHELSILHTGNLTGLIVDPLPVSQKVNIIAPTKTDVSVSSSEPSPDNKTLFFEQGKERAVADSKNQPKARAAVAFSNQPKTSTAVAPSGQPKTRPTVIIPGQPKARPTAAFPNQPKTEAAPSNNQKLQDQAQPAASSRSALGQSALQPTEAMPKSRRPAFGDIPATEMLRPTGHSKPDLSIRWITKQNDGLYLQSKYGILRLSPIGSAILRVSFVRNGQPDTKAPWGIDVNRTERFWMYREMGNLVELSMDELILQVSKSTGAIRYFTGDKKLLLAEHDKECRLLENPHGNSASETYGKGMPCWLFLDWAKGEQLYSFGNMENEKTPTVSRKSVTESVSRTAAPGQSCLNLRGQSRFISHKDSGKRLPFLLSDKGYGLLFATKEPAFCCDIPAYGSYIYTQTERQMDYYIIVGKRQDTILNACSYLCGTL